MRRTHLAKDDLDWLPERYRLLRGAVVSGVWTSIGAGFLALVTSGAPIIVFGKLFVVFGAAGYWAGDRVAKKVVSARLGKLARGQVDLARLSNEEDGELVHVRGRVRAVGMIEALASDAAGVYRRTRTAIGDLQLVDEEGVDFQLVDEDGHAIGIEVDGARLLVDDGGMDVVDEARLERFRRVEPARLVLERCEALRELGRAAPYPRITAAETLLRPGDLVEAVGYKGRRVDPTVVDRLAREAPMRATLRAGKDLPVILSLVDRAARPADAR